MKKQKIKTDVDPTNEIVKTIKSVLLESMVREWLNTPVKVWDNKTPLQMIRKGSGQMVLDSVKQAEEDLKLERKSPPEPAMNIVPPNDEVLEESEDTDEPVHQCCNLI